MQKNTAGKWVVFAYGAPDHATLAGLPITGDAANITGNVRIDGGAANAIDDTNPAELEGGYYVFDITATENNGDMILIAPVSATSDVIVIGVPGVYDTTPANFQALGIESDGDVTKVNLVATTSVNSDMRGTDGVDTATMRGTDGANTVTPDAAGVAATQAEVATECAAALVAIELHRLIANSVGDEVVDDSIIAQMTAIAGDWSDFAKATDSLQAIRDRGDAAWITGESTLFPSAGWRWSTATSGVPIAGRLRGNNATIASITELSIHEETDDGRNAGIVISALRSGDRIGIFFDANPDVFLIFDVTATPILTGSVYAVTGTVDTTAGSFANTVVTVGYQITGDAAAAVANRKEMDSNSVDFDTIITGVAAIPLTAMRGTDNALLASGYTAPDNAGISSNGSDIAALNDLSFADIWTGQLTESYAANGVAFTPAQGLFAIHQDRMDFSIAGTVYTTRKLDGATTAFIKTLNDATNPTASTRT